MVTPILRLLNFVPKTIRCVPGLSGNFLLAQSPALRIAALPGQPCRMTSFFNKIPAENIWKGVTSVSNAGKKRGRGKGTGRKTAKNLNRGQVIGVGKLNIMWPGLSAPILQGKDLVRQQQLPEDTERMAKLVKMRDEMSTFRYLRLLPIERGWSGTKLPGRSIGPPDPVGDDAFEGFDTKVLEFKSVFHMKGNFGRRRRMSCMAITGNGKGLAGFGLAKSVDGRSAVKRARNRAGQKLMYIELYNNHTVMHDFFTQFGRTKIFVTQKPEGFGLVCHRAIKTMCEVIGIKDLYAKVEGSTNLQHIVKAFFIGLLKQKTHKQMAEEKGLHLVEFKKEQGYFPKVIASPTKCRSKAELKPDELLDYSQYVMDGRVVLKKKKYPKFYVNTPGWQIHLKKYLWRRNHDDVRLRMVTEQGEIRSFLTDKYPEAKPQVWVKKRQEEQPEE
ncbi:small ribosomal subunit protein uS5m [Neocloeon triangulifer]|uniref:small ribosomal subunit protein uS5m n=1 Tax=Neocloeon triangulifer TaxID=2078957 RepID=UPI00286F57F7|nr:small ribosomal subunit protein uS5m [Neocloeon triangulifer]